MVKPKYYLVERTLLPEVFQRVIEANEAIASGKAATASEAAKIAGLSRSAYYKYKDGVRPFFEATTDRIVTYHFMLHDQPGVLSSILGPMSARSCAARSSPAFPTRRCPFTVSLSNSTARAHRCSRV